MSVSSIRDPMSFSRQGQKLLIPAEGFAKVGGTAGWAVRGANNLGVVTLPASQTGSKLIIPVVGLKVGSIITGFYLLGQVDSVGGIVTIDADLRRHTVVAADVADASVGAITQISVTADAAIGPANSRKADLAESIADLVSYYLVITATTAAVTDIALMGAVIEYTER